MKTKKLITLFSLMTFLLCVPLLGIVMSNASSDGMLEESGIYGMILPRVSNWTDTGIRAAAWVGQGTVAEPFFRDVGHIGVNYVAHTGGLVGSVLAGESSVTSVKIIDVTIDAVLTPNNGAVKRINFINHEDGTVLDKEAAEGGTLSLPNIVTGRAGFRFWGWVVDEIIRQPGFELTDITEDMTIAGSWIREYRIVFNGAAPQEHCNVTVFTIYELPLTLSDANRAGYKFSGWFTAPIGGSRVTQIFTGGDTAVYARWAVAATTFTITLRNVRAAEHHNPHTVTSVDLPIHLTAATREGYNFKGWWTAPTGGVSISVIDEAVNVVLYARWSPIDSTAGGPGLNDPSNPLPWLAIGICVGIALWLGFWFAFLKKKFVQ